MILVIDNYDSFTWNLVQVFQTLGHEVTVKRNDEVPVADLVALAPSHLVVSPGPGQPNDAGVSMAALAHFAGRIPVLGVCLGHQALAQAFGGRVVRAGRLMHGKTSLIHHDGAGIFRGAAPSFSAMRYHSLIVERTSLPSSLEVTAWTQEGEVMALQHTPTGAQGLQFHPESILTPAGPALLAEFLQC